MPIYEFYCPDCHTIFNFLSKSVDTTGVPACPSCKGSKMTRQVSLFAALDHRDGGGDEMDDLPIDESKMEAAVEALASEAEGMDENDPKAAADMMRKFSKMTGLEFGGSVEEALSRMESGEDPEQVEAELGDAMESEDPFVVGGGPKVARKAGKRRRGAPRRDKIH